VCISKFSTKILIGNRALSLRFNANRTKNITLIPILKTQNIKSPEKIIKSPEKIIKSPEIYMSFDVKIK
jgi:hypothetical protein